MKVISRKLQYKFIYVSIILFCVILLVPINDSTQFWNQELSNTAKSLTEIYVSFPYDSQAENRDLEELVDRFEAEQSELRLVAEYYPRDDAWQAVYREYSGDSQSDLMLLDHTMLAAFQKLGLLQPLSDYWERTPATDSIYTKLKEAVSIKGEPYGLPFSASTFAIWMNMDILAKYNLRSPSSWADIMHIAIEIDREPADAIAIAAAPGEHFTQTLLQMILGNGSSMRNLRGEEAEEILELIKEFSDQRLLARDSVNWNRQDLIEKFATRQVAMIITDSSQLPRLESYDPDFAWMISAIPQQGSSNYLILGESMALLSEHADSAVYDFMDFLLEEDEIIWRSQHLGSIPVRFDVESDVFALHNKNSVFIETFYRAENLPQLVLWQNISETVQEAGLEAIGGQSSAEEIAQKLHAQVITYIIDGN